MRLVAATRSGIAVADDNGVRKTWTGDVRCLADGENRLYAGTQSAGVLRSEDGGETWNAAGLAPATVKSLAACDGLVAAGTQPPAVFLSRDGGSTWEECRSFRSLRRWYWWQPADVPHTPYVSALALDGTTILAGIEAARVLRSTDGGKTWSRLRRGIALDCHGLALSGDHAYEGAGLGPAWSSDGGRTWKRERTGLDRRYVMALTIDPVDPECWYVAAAPLRTAHTSNSRACVFRWTGERWRKLSDELEHLPNVLASPAANRIYAGLRDGTAILSADRGETWTVHPHRFDRLRSLVVLQPQDSVRRSAG